MPPPHPPHPLRPHPQLTRTHRCWSQTCYGRSVRLTYLTKYGEIFAVRVPLIRVEGNDWFVRRVIHNQIPAII